MLQKEIRRGRARPGRNYVAERGPVGGASRIPVERREGRSPSLGSIEWLCLALGATRVVSLHGRFMCCSGLRAEDSKAGFVRDPSLAGFGFSSLWMGR